MKVIGIKIYHFSKWTLVFILVCLALLSLAGRTLLSNVEYFKNSIQQELADYGIKGVTLENIEGHWQGLQPILKIKGASLSIPGHSHALSVSEMTLRVKLVPSLLSRDLILESFNSSIEKLVLVRGSKGIWWLNDIPLSAGKSGNAYLDIYSLFQALPTFVNIDIGLIQLRDQYFDEDYLIQNSTLRSSRKKQQLSLQLLTRLPSSIGHQVNFYLKGNALNQKLFIDASNLDLAKLFRLISVEEFPLNKAKISLQSWVDFERFSLKRIITEADVLKLSVDSEQKKSQALKFSFQQQLDTEPDQWRINTRIYNFKKDKQKVADINAQLLINKQGAKPLLWVDRIKLDLVHSVLQQFISDEKTLKLLTELKPVAIIDNIIAELDLINPQQTVFGFNFSDWSSKYYHSIPAVNGARGSLIYSQGVSQLTIDAEQVSIDFGDWFRQPIKLDTLKAINYVYLKNSAVHVDTESFSMSNSDASLLQGRSWLQIPAKGRAFLSLRSHYKNANVNAVSRYLPVKIMPENVINWLDKSLLSGKIPQGDFLFHGRLIKPSVFTEKQTGVLHASFDISKAEVDYLQDWPIARQGDAKIEFFNSSMLVDISSINYTNTMLDKVSLTITDFRRPNLLINATLEKDAKNILSSLSDLPILNIFDEVKQKTTLISGPIKADLKLDIPLSKELEKQVTVTASADLKGVALTIPEWMVNFKEMKGVVEIVNEKVSASALSGKFYDDRVQLSIKPQTKRKRTQFHLSGNVHTRNLLKLAPDYLQQPVSGSSPWDVSVSVGHNPSKTSAILDISATSSLSGTEFNFPQPSKVSAVEKAAVSFNAKLFNEGDFPFDVSLADKVLVNGRLNLLTDSDNLIWLNVGLGDSKPLNSQTGVTVEGNTELIDLNDWFAYQDMYFAEESADSSPFLQQVKSVNLNIDQFVLGDQVAFNSTVNVLNNGKQLQGYIDSDQTKGNFELPYKMGVLNPFTADLDFMKLVSPESKEKSSINIKDMPNLFIKSKQVSYDKMNFSDFTLSTRREANNFVVEQLDFKHQKVRLKSSGQWQFDPQTKEHVSVFNIDIKGSDFGQTIKELGLGETIRGSKVEFNGQIGWGGELYSINWPTLIGEVDIKLKQGYLNNVNPGAGRFVGLLSFSALPKRLFLDFGDVVKEGMHFNEIKGKFTILGELMETKNATLDSAAAKVKIYGNTNLRHQTYDQTMTIIPKIGDTLPLIGTIASGSAVGWGLLLLQKIFKKPIEKSVEIEYKVSGSWDNPEVDLIEKPKVKQQSDRINDADF